jgi:outer membrane protein OmpA-like peptidoglycan-associated protein
VFTGEKLTPAAVQRIEALGRIAKANRGYPVAAVVHQDKEPAAKDEAASNARAAALAAAFRSAGVATINVLQAGAVAPVVDPQSSDRTRNQRVEIVFITPETF